MITKSMLSVFPPERLPLLLLLTLSYCDRYAHSHSNCYRDCDCDFHSNCYSDGNCDSDGNCHSHRFRQSDTDTQANSYSETPHDTEAAPDSAAKAGRSEPVIR